MSLTKQDLKDIKGLIDQSAKSTISQTKVLIEASADEINRNTSDQIYSAKKQILNEMDERFTVAERNLSREISDLADINRAFMTRTDEIDHRVRIVERKLGLKSK